MLYLPPPPPGGVGVLVLDLALNFSALTFLLPSLPTFLSIVCVNTRAPAHREILAHSCFTTCLCMRVYINCSGDSNRHKVLNGAGLKWVKVLTFTPKNGSFQKSPGIEAKIVDAALFEGDLNWEKSRKCWP